MKQSHDRDLFGEISFCRKTTQPRGYAANPGSGPKGETCETCGFLTKRYLSNRIVYKCRYAEYKWTNGRGSDILIASPACIKWEVAGDETTT